MRSAARILGTERATPATPPSGTGEFFTGTDGVPRHINDAGTVTDLGGGGGAEDQEIMFWMMRR